jgi:hypothetical protein
MARLIATHVKNPFDPLNSREIKEFPEGWTVAECLVGLGLPVDGDYVVAIDGAVLSGKDLTTRRPAASLTVCPSFGGGGGGKNILHTIAMLAVMAASVAAGQYWLTVKAGSMAVAYGIAASVSIIGGLLVNALLPTQTDIAGGVADFSHSSTYGWQVDANADRENVPWPVLYGTHRITPPIIAKYIEVVGDKQYYNILYVVADHEIDAIDEGSIEINGNPVANGDDGITWETRPGYTNQAPIQYFNDTRTMKSVNMKLSPDWTTVQTEGNSVEGLSVAVTLPGGLYYAADNGALTTASVKIDIEYRLLPAGEWQRLQGVNATDVVVTEARWSGGCWIPGSWWEETAGSTDPAAHLEGEVYWGSAYYFSGEISYSERVARYWHWLPTAQAVKAPGEATVDYLEVVAAQSSAIRRVWYMDRLAVAGEYEIRARLHEAPPDGPRYSNAVWFDYVEEIIYDDFSYPGCALFALRALATDKYSSGLPAVSLVATRSTVPVWNGFGYTMYPANNPAWQAYDMLRSSDYGGAVSPERILLDAIAAWAEYCDRKGYHSNIYFDSVVSLRKALDMICALGEGAVSQLGSRFTAFVDEEIAFPVQSFMFNEANTIRDSYRESYMAADDRATAVEIVYWDSSSGYERRSVELQAADYDSTTEEIKSTQLTLVGCTSRDEAVKHGRRALARNRYLTRVSVWDAGFDAIGCLPWDPVVAPRGVGGRVVSGTENTVTLDRQVLLEPGRTYIVRVKDAADDSVREAAVVPVVLSTATETLPVVEAFSSIPKLHDLYLFYEQGEEESLMRVLSITRKDDLTRRITAIEYNPLACDDSGVLPAPEAVVNPHYVDHLRAVEVYRGGAETHVSLSWTGFAILWRVWWKKADATRLWTYAGETAIPSYELRGLDYGQRLLFAVGHTRNINDAEVVDRTLVGKLYPPGDITSITATPKEDEVVFSWAALPDFDVTGYRVRSGVHWASATLYDNTGIYVVPTDGTARRWRCTAAGFSGATEPVWPSSGAVTDGTVEWTDASDDWAWQDITDTVFSVSLSGAEQIIQCMNRFTVRLWVVGCDAFENVSDHAATAADMALNRKPYITVGVTTTEGTFSDLDEAAKRLPSSGGKIVVRNGEYHPGDSIIIPDANIEIVGESRGGVNIYAPAGVNLFILPSADKKLSFSAFTIIQETAEGKAMFALLNSYASLRIQGITFNLAGGGHYGAAGGLGVFCKNFHGQLDVQDNIFQNGESALYCDWNESPVIPCPRANIIRNTIDGNSFVGIRAIAISTLICSDNILTNQTDSGLYIYDCINGYAIRNNISFRPDEYVGGLYTGIYHEAVVGGFDLDENTISIQSSAGQPFKGIHKSGAYLDISNSISRNHIMISSASSFGIKGIVVENINSNRIHNNEMHLANSAGEADGFSVHAYLTHTSNNNIFNNNCIKFDAGAGYNIGFFVTSQCNNNSGFGNTTQGADMKVLNVGGTGNDIRCADDPVNVEFSDINGGEWS